MPVIRRCPSAEIGAVLQVINAAAQAYRGVIPPDCWHEPYMGEAELRGELAAGVHMWGLEAEGRLVGVMGLQSVQDIDLIRHAYVLPAWQRHGVGATLITELRERSSRAMLVGTWAAATWAIGFYRRHGFELVRDEHKSLLLERYWSISPRQSEVSVVLANPPQP